ncbi:hypothetical protein GCM10007148_04110 [Parvularcula lutaonensis]|nr:hypothetical protein GCM10007148_04110 [Parvularcula lutaonensis]
MPALLVGTAQAQLQQGQNQPGQTGGVQAPTVQPSKGTPAVSGGRQGRSLINSWSLDLSLNYTDNFARIQEGDYERRFLLDGQAFASTLEDVTLPDGTTVQAVVPVSDTVPLEKIGKLFASASMSGASVMSRPGMRGLLRGTVRVGHYFDGTTFAEEVEDDIQGNLPAILDQVPQGVTIEPVVGGRGAFRETFVDPNISGIAQVDIVDKLLFIEGGGFVTEQQRGNGGFLTQQQAGQNFGEIIVGGFFISPGSRIDLPSQQAVELRLRNSSVVVIDEVDDPNFGGTVPQLGDSVSNEARIAYSSGSLLPKLGFSTEVFARRFEEEGTDTRPEQTLDQLSGSVAVNYDVNPRFSLLGVVGYDDAEIASTPAPLVDPLDPTAPPTPQPETTSDISGAFYTAGFSLRSSKGSSISLSVGERFNGTQINGDLRWIITPRMRASVGVNRRLSSGLQELQEQQVRLNNVGINFIEQLRSQNIAFSDRDVQSLVNVGFGNAAQISQGDLTIRPITNVNANLSGNAGRTSWAINSFVIIPEKFDPNPDDGIEPGAPSKRISVGAQVSRNLNRRLRVGVQARSLHLIADEDSTNPFDRDASEFLFGVTAGYAINRRWAVTAGYSHLRRDVDETGGPLSLFGGTPFDFQENVVRVGTRLTF